MNPERWAEVERVFHAASARPADERAAFLRDACGDDDALRGEVQSLLAQPASDRGFLDGPAVAVAAQMVSETSVLELTGRRLGAYQVQARIGAGGMGEVYRAHDTKLGRDVAIKILPRAFTSDPDRLARFEREARMLAALNHPHIGAIYGLEDADGIRALVLELVDGETLADGIARGPMPLKDVLPIARQITEALDAAHDKGIVHRDLKPGNIKVTMGGAVKVLDFGLAKAALGDGLAPNLTHSPTMTVGGTRAGVILGTAAYMSPEQARGLTVDKRTDVWAFGCVLYEMLSGRPAFARETLTDTLAAILEREPDWAALPPSTPHSVRRLLARCLEKDPRRRLRDIADAPMQLEVDPDSTSQAGEQDQPRAADSARVAQGAPRFFGRRAALWVVAGVCSAAVALVLVDRGRPPVRHEPRRVEVSTGVRLTDASPFVISPDSRYLAFAGSAIDGVVRLWVHSFQTGEDRPLPGTEIELGGMVPPMFWSPDSRFIAFDATGQVKKVEVTGGAPQTVCVLPSLAIGGSWNQDNVILVGSPGGGLVRCPASGGAASIVTHLDRARQESAHLFPWFLPDGRRFLYLSLSRGAPENSGIYVRSLDALPEAPGIRILASGFRAAYIADGERDVGHLLFIRDGALSARAFDPSRLELTGEAIRIAGPVGSFLDNAFFSASRDGTLAFRPPDEPLWLTWLDRRGNVLKRVGDPGLYKGLALNRDATRAVVVKPAVRATVDQDLWLVDLGSGRSSRLTSDDRLESEPVWSADDKRVFFTEGGAIGSLFEQFVNGDQEARLLLRSEQHKIPSSSSHDGRFLLYTSETIGSTRSDVWALPLTGDQRGTEPLIRRPKDQQQGQISPDGRLLAYVSNESDRQEVVVRTFAPEATNGLESDAESVTVSKSGGTAPRWSADGKEIFFITREGAIASAAVSTRPVISVDVPIILFRAPGLSTYWGVAGSGDGVRFLVLAPEVPTASTSFSLILDWQGILDPR